jgi:hypothetical protein
MPKRKRTSRNRPTTAICNSGQILRWFIPIFDNRGSQLGFPDTDTEGAVEMTQSDWLMLRGAVAHQGVFISSKKVPYGAGLTLMAPPTTDTGQTGNLSDPPPHIFRGSFLFFFAIRHSHFDRSARSHLSSERRRFTLPHLYRSRPTARGTKADREGGRSTCKLQGTDQWGGGTNRWASRIASRMLST